VAGISLYLLSVTTTGAFFTSALLGLLTLRFILSAFRNPVNRRRAGIKSFVFMKKGIWSLLAIIQSNIGYYQSNNGYFQSDFGYFQSNISYFQSDFGYFQSDFVLSHSSKDKFIQ
jgi:hypothetical protein